MIFFELRARKYKTCQIDHLSSSFPCVECTQYETAIDLKCTTSSVDGQRAIFSMYEVIQSIDVHRFVQSRKQI